MARLPSSQTDASSFDLAYHRSRMAKYDDRRGVDDPMNRVNTATTPLIDTQQRWISPIDIERWNRADSRSDCYFSDRWRRNDAFLNPVSSNRSTHAIDAESVMDIDRKVDKVIEDIWSTVEYENACREIDEHLFLIERIEIENTIDDELLDRYRSNHAARISKTDTIELETENRNTEFRSQTKETVSPIASSERDQEQIDEIEETTPDFPELPVPICTSITISDVFKVWKTVRSESERQSAIAVRFDIESW